MLMLSHGTCGGALEAISDQVLFSGDIMNIGGVFTDESYVALLSSGPRF